MSSESHSKHDQAFRERAQWWPVRALYWVNGLFGPPNNDSALLPKPPKVDRSPGKATLRFSVGRLETHDFDRDLAALAQDRHLHYSSTIGSGLALKQLDATVRGDDEQIDAFVERASVWVRNPTVGSP